MAEACLDGVGLNYRRVGSGDDVVLVHGLAASQAFWKLEIVEALARDHRVTTFDLRGHGYSAMPPSGYRPADLAADLGGLLDHLGIARAHLVGHSYGGVVALQFALGHPDRVASLVVADARVRALQPGQALAEDRDWPTVRSLFARLGLAIDEDDPEIGVRLLEALAAPGWGEARRRFAERSRFIPFGGGGKRSAARWRRLLATTTAGADFRSGAEIAPGSLERFRRPVLALYGERSPHRRTCEGLVARLADCEAIIVPDAGHFHPFTRPDIFREEVMSFLHDAGAPSGRVEERDMDMARA